jgi:hypothetical protein
MPDQGDRVKYRAGPVAFGQLADNLQYRFAPRQPNVQFIFQPLGILGEPIKVFRRQPPPFVNERSILRIGSDFSRRYDLNLLQMWKLLADLFFEPVLYGFHALQSDEARLLLQQP